jgi:hypothetical protein
MSYRHPLSALITALPLMFTACEMDGGKEGTADVSLELVGSSSALADAVIAGAPASPVRSAVVTIDEIYLQPAEGIENDRVVLRDTPITTDLLTLARDTATLVEGALVPAGRYSELRFVSSGAYIEVVGEGLFATPGYDEVPASVAVVGTLKTPSFDSSGLKVKLPSDDMFDGPGLHQIVLARFDVAESFGHAAGNGWVMHPVIEATAIETTARILLRLDARPVIDRNGPLTGEPWIAVLWDRDGFVELATDLVPEREPGRFVAELPFLLPEEGPFRITLQTATGLAVATQPPLPTELPVAAKADLEIEAMAVTVGP